MDICPVTGIECAEIQSKKDVVSIKDAERRQDDIESCARGKEITSNMVDAPACGYVALANEVEVMISTEEPGRGLMSKVEGI